MGIDLEYNNASLSFDPPDRVAVDLYSPAQVELLEKRSLVDILLNAGVREWLSKAPLFVVNDGHRNTPTPEVLNLLESIDPSFLDRSRFLIAVGTHDFPTEPHFSKIFGPYLDRVRDRVSVHSALDPELSVPIGKDRFDLEVMLNRLAVEASRIIVINSVEPHYFAGFSGGRKSFFPGLSDLTTIERNHNMAASLDAQPMALAGNPVAEHLDSLLDLIETDTIFSIQLVNDASHRIVGLSAGDIRGAFAEAVRLATQVYSYEAEQPYDLVIAEMRSPLDANLYQAQKALENTRAAVKDGGACVVVSACAQGIGSPHFYKLAGEWDRDKNAPLNGPARFGSHKLARVNLLSRKITVGLKSELDKQSVTHVFYEPIDDLNRFVEKLSLGNEEYRVAVVKDAGNTVLKVKYLK